VNSGIPKRIIQTDKSHDLALLSKAAVANVRLLNPDFEYFFSMIKELKNSFMKNSRNIEGCSNRFAFPFSVMISSGI